MVKNDRKIVAIGGGSIRNATMLSIEKEVVKLTKKKKPTLLFIPTASSDDIEYWGRIQKHFSHKLTCTTEVLFLIRDTYTKKALSEKILSADIIYVGGGNTLMMMKLWRKLGVDRLLKKAWVNGTVLCGLSAGSICWFESGHSDSMSFYNPEKWNYINVRGLGFLKGIHCPHYDSHTLNIPRREHFQNMLKKTGGFGIAIDDNCAIEFINDTYRVISSQKGASAYLLYKKQGNVCEEKILEHKEFLPITNLYRKK